MGVITRVSQSAGLGETVGQTLGLGLMVGVTLPWNRLFIIGLATVAVAGMYVILFRTGAGLRIRAVTQNRSMAACLGVRAGTVDATTFALGAGLAGYPGTAALRV